MPVLYFWLAASHGFRGKSRLVFLALFFSMPAGLLAFIAFVPAGIQWRIDFSSHLYLKGLLESSLASTFIDWRINLNPTWSLSLEFLFYMAIPFLLKIFTLLNRRYELLFAALFLFCLLTALTFPNALAGSWRFMAFSFGILLIPAIRFIDQRELLRRWIKNWGLLSLVCVLGCQISWVSVFSVAVDEIQKSFYLLCDLVFFFLVISALSDGGPLRRLFLLMPLRFVGNISYSLISSMHLSCSACVPIYLTRALPASGSAFFLRLVWLWRFPPLFSFLWKENILYAEKGMANCR